jgi:hypothetical protein
MTFQLYLICGQADVFQDKKATIKVAFQNHDDTDSIGRGEPFKGRSGDGLVVQHAAIMVF